MNWSIKIVDQFFKVFVDFSRGEKNRPFRSMIGSLLHTLRSYAELAEPSSWIVTHALTTHPFTSTFNSRQSLISHAAGMESERGQRTS